MGGRGASQPDFRCSSAARLGRQRLLHTLDQRALIVLPGMEAGPEEAQVRQENLARDDGLEYQELEHAPPGTRCIDAILTEEVRHSLEVGIPELQADEHHHARTDRPAPPR